MSFLELQTTRKGAQGERIIERWIRAKGWRYDPAPDRAHTVDFFAIVDGERIAIEVKTYPRRYSRADTGIDAADYQTYCRMHTRVLLLFVDSFERSIYGQWIDQLEVNSRAHGKVYFALHQLRILRALTADELAELSKYPLPERYAYTARHFGAR